MKTLQQLKKLEEKLVQQIESEQKDETKPGSAFKKHKPAILFYRLCINYLQTDPCFEYLQKEFNKLTNRLNKILSCAPLAENNNPFQNEVLKKYHKENDTAHIKSQVEALKFLLED